MKELTKFTDDNGMNTVNAPASLANNNFQHENQCADCPVVVGVANDSNGASHSSVHAAVYTGILRCKEHDAEVDAANYTYEVNHRPAMQQWTVCTP